MSLTRKPYIKCDGCGTELPVSPSPVTARIEASKVGWEYVPGKGRGGDKSPARDLCGRCASR